MVSRLRTVPEIIESLRDTLDVLENLVQELESRHLRPTQALTTEPDTTIWMRPSLNLEALYETAYKCWKMGQYVRLRVPVPQVGNIDINLHRNASEELFNETWMEAADVYRTNFGVAHTNL